MRGSIIIVFLVAIVAAFIAMDNNTTPLTVTLGPLAIESSLGIILLGTFGFGTLTGLLTVVPSEYKRMRNRRTTSREPAG